MKKILSIFLVALSAIGLTATATNQVYAAPNQPDILIKGLGWSDHVGFVGPDGELELEPDGANYTFVGMYEYQFTVGDKYQLVFPENYLLKITSLGSPYDAYDVTDNNLISNGYTFTYYEEHQNQQEGATFKGDNGNDYVFKMGHNFVFELINQDLRPAISGQETFATKVDEARPVEYFIGFLKAIDDIDGDISDDIYIVTDNYTPNKSVLGTHDVKVGVEDSSGNVSEFTFKVSVVDITAPIINGNATAVSIGYKETYNIERG